MIWDTDASGTAFQVARLVCCGRLHLITGLFVNGQAFPRQGRFVDSTGPFDDIPINGDVFPRTNNKNIANLHCLDGNGRFLAINKQGGCLRRHLHEALESVRRAALGNGFQGLSHRNEGRNHGGRFEVKVLHITHHEFLLRRTMRAKVRDIIQDIEAPQERYTRAQGNKGIHVGGQMLHALETADEKGAVDEHNDESKEQLRNAHAVKVPIKEGWQRKMEHIVPHGQIHEDEQKTNGIDETPLQFRRFRIL